MIEELNPSIIVLRCSQYRFNRKGRGIHGTDVKYVILYPENGGRMMLRNTDHPHTTRRGVTRHTEWSAHAGGTSGCTAATAERFGNWRAAKAVGT
jgi:hypothetical protein